MDLETCLQSHLSRVDGLIAIVVADRDGIIVGKVTSGSVPDKILEPSTLTAFATSLEQASKLGLDKSRSIVSIFEKHQLVVMGELPLIICILGTFTSATGSLVTCGNELHTALEPLVATFRRKAHELGLE